METRETFIVCKHWVEAIGTLPEEYQLELFKALAAYGFTGQIPDGISSISRAILVGFSKEMDNNHKRYQASVENGKLGGRPRKEEGEKSEEKAEEKPTEKPRKTQQNPKQSRFLNENLEKPIKTQQQETQNLGQAGFSDKNLYDYDYDNDNEYVDVSCQSIKERVRACTDPEKILRLFYACFREYKLYWGVYDNLFLFTEIMEYMRDYILEARKNPITFNKKIYDEDALLDVFSKLTIDDINELVFQLRFSAKEIVNMKFYILGTLINRSIEPKKRKN